MSNFFSKFLNKSVSKFDKALGFLLSEESEERKTWRPTDPNDLAFLAAAQGSTMEGTILPSGIEIPPGQWVVAGQQLVKPGDYINTPEQKF